MSHKKRRPFFFDSFKHYVIHNIIHIHNIMATDNATILIYESSYPFIILTFLIYFNVHI